jgi:hypothetical protein
VYLERKRCGRTIEIDHLAGDTALPAGRKGRGIDVLGREEGAKVEAGGGDDVRGEGERDEGTVGIDGEAKGEPDELAMAVEGLADLEDVGEDVAASATRSSNVGRAEDAKGRCAGVQVEVEGDRFEDQSLDTKQAVPLLV